MLGFVGLEEGGRTAGGSVSAPTTREGGERRDAGAHMHGLGYVGIG